MSELFQMLSASHDVLPHELMQEIAEDAGPTARMKKRGKTYTYSWPDLTVRIKAMSPRTLSAKVTELLQYVSWIAVPNFPLLSRETMAMIRSQSLTERDRQILRRLHRTRLGIEIEVDPEPDREGRVNQVFSRLCPELRPIQYPPGSSALFDWKGRVLLEFNGSFDRKAEID